MLSVPTLWTAFVINFLALGLIWAYVMRSYPAFAAARFWTGGGFAAAGGGGLGGLGGFTGLLLPRFGGGPGLIFGARPAGVGVKQFFGGPGEGGGAPRVPG